MTVLTQVDLWRELKGGADGEGLVITPILDEANVGTSSVDVHLGHEFILFKRASVACFDIRDGEQNVYKYQEKLRISRRHTFILHPHQLVLGATIEYVSLPKNITGHVSGRSTWGRTGLIIATATEIAPGFKGCVTLELINQGEIPLVLFPGLCVAQITLLRTESPAVYEGRYDCPTGPEFPKLKDELSKVPPFYKPHAEVPRVGERAVGADAE